MSKDQRATVASTGPGEAVPLPGGAVPLLRTLGDANAAVCVDGFCEVPPRQEAVPVQEATPGDDGSHE
jgi:hypothetical protein